jgi:hypothetical protein
MKPCLVREGFGYVQQPECRDVPRVGSWRTPLFPDRMDEYAGFAAYFHSWQKWFYAARRTVPR